MRVIINIVAALTIVIGGWVLLATGPTPVGLLLVLAGSMIVCWEIYEFSVGKGWIPAPKIALTKATRKAYEQTQE